MSEDRIRLLMGDFTKNAGLVGLHYMLEVNGAVKNTDYGIEEQAVWLNREYALQTDWTDLYFKAFVRYFAPSTTWQRLLDVIEDMQAVLKQENWQADKKVKEKLKFINDKLLSNSYKSGFENIRNRIENPEIYEKLNQNKLSEKMETAELSSRLEELKTFLIQPLCRETFVMKGVIYNYINRFWDGKCFLLRANAKKDVREVYEADFSVPLKKFWSSSHEKAKELCVDCGEAMDAKEKTSIAFMKDAADDLNRKRSAFWNGNVDAFLCPACTFLYSLVPLGFQLLGNRFLFINRNDSMESLLSSNAKEHIGIERERKESEGEKVSAWFARMMNLILKGKEGSVHNIQVILKSMDAQEHYLFQIINREIMLILQDAEVKKRLEKLSEHPFCQLNGEPFNVYERTVLNILQYRSQYSLENRLLKQSLKGDSAWTGYLAGLIHDIQLRSMLIRKRETEKEKKAQNNLGGEKAMAVGSYAAMTRNGYLLRKEMEKKNPNVEEALRGTVYQLLNALSVKNESRFMDIVLRLYCSCQMEIPAGFTRMLGDRDQLQAYGYAFVFGLKGSYFEKEKKEDTENKEGMQG